jgi:aryl-alcohol dehydrogenase-like predicted oxidoreductase
VNYVKLGRTGLQVSSVCLGCMAFAEPGRGTHSWALGEAASRPVLRHALDQGINFFDTGNSYSGGTSEEIVGRALGEMARRDEIVIATKIFYPLRPGPNMGGLSRKAIMTEIEASLRRLGTDYVDLYQIHRWDPGTPIEETLEALQDVVKGGKARYVGASSMYAWQFAKALYTADNHGFARFATMQNHLNLMNREEEREMLPLCEAEGIGVLPWSPLARGRLALDWNESSERMEIDVYGKALYAQPPEAYRSVAERVGAVASRHGASRAQVALAWLMRKPVVVAPIIGAATPQQIDEAIGATRLRLEPEDVVLLEGEAKPHPLLDESAARWQQLQESATGPRSLLRAEVA